MNKAIPREVRYGFLICLFLLMISAMLPYRNIQHLQANERWVDHTLQVLQVTNDLRIAVTDAESGQRGFLLAQNPVYLEPYETSRKKISHYIDQLTSLTADNPHQQSTLSELKGLINSKFIELQTTIDLQNGSNRAEAMDIVATNRGHELMQNIRNVLDDFKIAERKLLSKRVADTKYRFQQTVYSFLFLTAFNLVLFIGVYILTIKSLKARRAAEISLQKQSNLTTSVVNSMSEGLYVMDLQGNTLLYNPVLTQIYGKKVAEFGPDDWQRQYQISNLDGDTFEFEDFPAVAVLNGELEAAAEMIIKPLDSGETKFIKVTARPLIGESGGLEGVVCVSSDISLEKRAALKLKLATQEAESANKAKSNFLANMSHEIRTPMNAVLGMTQLLHKTDLSKEQKKYLDMILLSSRSLMNVLNDILDFSKIEVDKIELVPQPFHLSGVVQALSPIMSMAAANKNIELVIDTRFKDSLLIGDSQRLHQILVNLVGNAIKFTDKGEVVVIISGEEETSDQVKIRFTVKDTGIGMTQAQQERLFSPFVQADSSITRQYGGTGLGLTIAQRLAKLMGGQLEVKSVLGRGSEFSTLIPFPVCDTADRDYVQPKSIKPYLLLVIDDNESARNSIANHLSKLQWNADFVTSSSEGIEALHKAKLANKTYDAILLDWRMQNSETVHAIKEIRNVLSHKAPIVLMVSMYDRDNISENKLVDAELEPIIFMFKPATASSIFDALNESFGNAPIEHSTLAIKEIGDTPLTGVRILLVEDNEFNQIVAKDFLQQAGAAIDVVDNGKKAVDVLLSESKHYDVVLMDVQMPVMDGFTATKLIRQSGITMPIIAMTAGVTEFERGACTASGMNDLIAKPIEAEKMLSTISLYTLGRQIDYASTLVSNEYAIHTGSDNFDVTNLVKMGVAVPGHLEKTITLVNNLVSNSRASFQKARAAGSQGEYEEVGSILHRLRGTLGVVGAKKFAEGALGVEELIRSTAKESDIDEALQLLEQDFNLTCDEAMEWVNGNPIS